MLRFRRLLPNEVVPSEEELDGLKEGVEGGGAARDPLGAKESVDETGGASEGDEGGGALVARVEGGTGKDLKGIREAGKSDADELQGGRSSATSERGWRE